MIKAVIFDLDGVIIDSKKHHFAAWKMFWAKRGVKHTKQDFLKHEGLPSSGVLIAMQGELGKRISRSEAKMLAKEKGGYYRQVAKGRLKPGKGARKLLSALRKAGIKTAIATACSKTNMDFAMRQINLGKYFGALLCSSDVKHGKPSPDVFLKAAMKLGVKPQSCAAIEDSNHGIAAAKRAGMKCIAVATTHKAENLKGADLVMKNLTRITLPVIERFEVIRRLEK